MAKQIATTGKGTVNQTFSLTAPGALSMTLAQPQRGPTTKEFMRDKLELSQRILEGVALEDYELIVTKATRLSAMSKETRWQAFQNPDYERYSAEFRRNVDALAKAARDKNLDGATLAYVRVTMSCVECHKFVRGKLIARLVETRMNLD